MNILLFFSVSIFSIFFLFLFPSDDRDFEPLLQGDVQNDPPQLKG